MARVDSAEHLRQKYRQPKDVVIRKVLPRLDGHCRRFIALSLFVALSSVGADGLADVSPRGGDPGFVEVLDDATLAIPDRPGNNRLDTAGNVLANPTVGLMFMIPGVDEVLRVKGTAELRDDDDLCDRFAVNGKRPATVMVITVKTAQLHCAKAIMRARLWQEDAKIDRARLPSLGQMIKDQIGLDEPADSQESMVARFREKLY